jgi:hypothetical protein
MSLFIVDGKPISSGGTSVTSAARTQQNIQNAAFANWGSVDGYSPIFTAQPNTTGSIGASYDLVPGSAGSHINVVTGFQWTRSKYREEVPRITLKELRVKGLQQLNYYYNLAMIGVNTLTGNTGDISDPYGALYDTEPTKFLYTLPFYNTTSTSSKQTWQEKVPPDADYVGALSSAADIAKPLTTRLLSTAATVLGGPVGRAAVIASSLMGSSKRRLSTTMSTAANIGVKAVGALMGSPYAGIEQPMYFAGTPKNSYVVSFPLFNTDSVAEIRKNYDFIKLFQYQNLMTRTSVATYLPPVIYKSMAHEGHNSSLGMRFFYVSDFTVNNLGALRSMNIGSSNMIPVPEAYQVNITLTEMIANSRNLYASVMASSGQTTSERVNLANTGSSTNNRTMA